MDPQLKPIWQNNEILEWMSKEDIDNMGMIEIQECTKKMKYGR